MSPLHRTGLAALALFALQSAARTRSAEARDEGILELHTDLTIGEDGGVAVTETILVWVTGAKIKSGIRWHVPTRYRDDRGDRQRVALQNLKVTRDGQAEPFESADAGDTQRLDIGRAGGVLEAGTHVYVVAYETERQVAFLADHDALFLPLVPAAHELPIAQAAAVAHLPRENTGAMRSFSGRVIGSDGAVLETLQGDRRNGAAVLTVTRPLATREGLTVVMTWSKGVVRAPPAPDRLIDVVGDNRGLSLAALALLAQVILVLAMRGAGQRGGGRGARGAQASATISAAPEGLSPAALRFLVRGRRADSVGLAAALLRMAADGHLTITTEADGDGDGDGDGEAEAVFVIARAAAPTGALAPEERAIAEALFRRGDTIRLAPDGAGGAIAAARAALGAAMAAEAVERRWVRDAGASALGIALSLLALIALVAGTRDAGAGAAGGAWSSLAAALLAAILPFWTAGAIALGAAYRKRRARARAGRDRTDTGKRAAGRWRAGVPLALVFLALEVGGLILFAALTAPIAAAALVATALLDYVLLHPASALTAAGRAARDSAAAYRRQPANRDGEADRQRSYAVALDLPSPASQPFVDAVSRAVRAASPRRPG
jgi:hypothetical protein